MRKTLNINRHGAISYGNKGFAWEWPKGKNEVDVTVQFTIDLHDGGPTLPMWFHTAAKRNGYGWRPHNLDIKTVEQILENGTLDQTKTLRESLNEEDLFDANWLADPIPRTRARRHEGLARAQLDRDLNLRSEDWMQDWPLEVANSDHLDRYCEYYDTIANPDAKFDCMSLCLHAWDSSARNDKREWFETRLLQNFSIFGHLVDSWCVAIDADPDYGYDISPFMRDIFGRGLVPIDNVILE